MNLTGTARDEIRRDIRAQLVAKLSNKEYRDVFVSEQINTGLAFQIKAIREKRGWSQAELGEKAGMAQSRISVMEDANYARFSLTTLKRLASAFDTGLLVKFAPYSELVSGFENLSPNSLESAPFDQDKFFQPARVESTSTEESQKITLHSNASSFLDIIVSTTGDSYNLDMDTTPWIPVMGQRGTTGAETI